MKNLPNLITSLRILMAAALFFIEPLGWVFAALYLLSGLSDVLDGFIARRLGLQSELGAKLDAIADFTFIAAMILNLWTIVAPPVYIIIWFCCIAAVKLAAATVCKLRFGAFTFLHSILNKITGAALFIYPLTLFIGRSEAAMAAACAIASLAAAEELIINLTAGSLNLNRRSILSKENPDALH